MPSADIEATKKVKITLSFILYMTFGNLNGRVMLYIELKAKINYKTAHPRYSTWVPWHQVYLGIWLVWLSPSNEVVIILIDFIRTNDSHGWAKFVNMDERNNQKQIHSILIFENVSHLSLFRLSLREKIGNTFSERKFYDI